MPSTVPSTVPSTTTSTTTSWRFADCVFDSKGRTLVRDGREERLSRRAFEALQLLLSRAPEAVSKDDLSTTLWPDTFVNLTNLNNVIAEIRTAIGDHDKKVVVTKHRFGYAMSVPVSSEPASPDGIARFALFIAGETLLLPPGDHLVGRSLPATIRIADPSVSRRHAVIRVNEDGAEVLDLHSKNGVYVGDLRVTGSSRLEDGTVIRFGNISGILSSVSESGTTMTAESSRSSARGVSQEGRLLSKRPPAGRSV